MKVCNICKQEKEFTEFYKNKSYADGFAGKCKICQKLYEKKYNKDNKPRLNAKSRAYYEEHSDTVLAQHRANSEHLAEYNREYKKTDNGKLARKREINLNPEKIKARLRVTHAVEKGTLIKDSCEICGELKVHAHHWSYKEENWLKVNWLCNKHHTQRHKWLKELGVII